MCLTTVLYCYHCKIQTKDLTTNEDLKGLDDSLNYLPYTASASFKNLLRIIFSPIPRSLISNSLVQEAKGQRPSSRDSNKVFNHEPVERAHVPRLPERHDPPSLNNFESESARRRVRHGVCVSSPNHYQQGEGEQYFHHLSSDGGARQSRA